MGCSKMRLEEKLSLKSRFSLLFFIVDHEESVSLLFFIVDHFSRISPFLF